LRVPSVQLLHICASRKLSSWMWCRSLPMFRRNILLQSSVLKSKPIKQPTRNKQSWVLTCSSTLKLETIRPSETSSCLHYLTIQGIALFFVTVAGTSKPAKRPITTLCRQTVHFPVLHHVTRRQITTV
jgi:hypothetical protein